MEGDVMELLIVATEFALWMGIIAVLFWLTLTG